MKIIGIIILWVVIGIAWGTLLTANQPHQVKRVAAQFCDANGCYMQDVPAAQFIGKPYTLEAPGHFRTCDLDGTQCPPTVRVGNRNYLLNPSEVTK
jgi:hypothetical protein